MSSLCSHFARFSLTLQPVENLNDMQRSTFADPIANGHEDTHPPENTAVTAMISVHPDRRVNVSSEDFPVSFFSDLEVGDCALFMFHLLSVHSMTVQACEELLTELLPMHYIPNSHNLTSKVMLTDYGHPYLNTTIMMDTHGVMPLTVVTFSNPGFDDRTLLMCPLRVNAHIYDCEWHGQTVGYCHRPKILRWLIDTVIVFHQRMPAIMREHSRAPTPVHLSEAC
jgi:hypothetical protein